MTDQERKIGLEKQANELESKLAQHTDAIADLVQHGPNPLNLLGSLNLITGCVGYAATRLRLREVEAKLMNEALGNVEDE